jgi:NAD(P)H-flavin reductase
MDDKIPPITYYGIPPLPVTRRWVPGEIARRGFSIAHPIEACYHAPVNAYTGRVTRIELGQDGGRRVEIACPQETIPAPGQYIQAHRKGDETVAVPFSIFLGGWPGEEASTFTAAPPIPPDWQPGDLLTLRGPLGQGFTLPPRAKRVGLVALGCNVARLLPLAEMALNQGSEVALFTDARLPRLPTQVEANPLRALPEALSWGDYLAFDGAPSDYGVIGESLNLLPETRLPCPAQMLVYLPMPCGGLGECGVCALPGKGRKYKLACVDGPVFAWGEVLLSV